MCADDASIACPLFHTEDGGEVPTSALQLYFSRFDIERALDLNKKWHSRLPILTNWQSCFAYQAEYNGKIYAVAIWGPPVARMLNNKGIVELRRMAITEQSPKNTASRMISWMVRDVRKTGLYKKAISYQDTDVHKGTIYKASGWKVGCETGRIATGWNSRDRNTMQTTSGKIRWEYDLKKG